jgi:signal recognition particle subunit SRP68
MDITKYVVEYREAAFLLGDYSTYRAQLTRRLRIVQKKLGRATPKNAKYAAKAPVTAEDISKNIEWVVLELMGVFADGQGSFTSSSSRLNEHGRMQWP